MDLWAQIYLLDGGERLGRTITGYRSRFFIPGRILPSGVVCDWRLKPGAAEHIDALLEDICLSMRAAHYLDIPPLVMNKVTVPLDNATMNTYRRMQKDLVADLTLIGGEIHTAANAAVMSSKLRQISAGFIFNDNGQGYTPLHSHKAEAIREIVDGTGSPVLVLYQFIPERDMLLRKLDGLAHLVSEPDAIKRWNRREIPVLLAHPASIGHGLNLQSGGHTMIWASIPWSLEEWEQTNARLARQGQQHSHVIQHVLLSPGTLDSQILAVVQGKKTVQDALKDALRYKDMELI
jgi:SNF2 family DNA or RNA helicase